MTSREKIIISLMAALVLWGLFVLVKGGGGNGEPAMKENTVGGLASNDFLNLQASQPGSNVVIYLEKAGTPYTANPFADANLPAVATATTIVTAATNPVAFAPVFIYSGHIKVGSREMAIINGQEYIEGEILSTGDYVVEKIFPDKVLLRSKTNGETKYIKLAEAIMK